MEFENLQLKCECKGNMNPIKTDWKGISVRGWKCKKCHEELIHPIDAQKALEIERARMNDELTVKLRKVGKSNVVTIPRLIMKTENLKPGKMLTWGIEKNKLILTPTH
ncbi:MAG TPA: hypothetical protein VJJ21_04430 [Candidatus Nanoarchaeia archaeon]|nr:hypothetical protein [Candidatus Nanoarchaeia archaeon]